MNHQEAAEATHDDGDNERVLASDSTAINLPDQDPWNINSLPLEPRLDSSDIDVSDYESMLSSNGSGRSSDEGDSPSGSSAYHSRKVGGRTKLRGRRTKTKTINERHVQVNREQMEEEIVERLMSLNLPNMPTPAQLRGDEREPPTLRILVVADIDLESASALAESALATSVKRAQDKEESTTDDSDGNPTNPLHQVDLCVACGPFCREDDLRRYYEGRQRRRHLIRQYVRHPISHFPSRKTPNNSSINRSGSSTSSNGPTQVFLDSNVSSGESNGFEGVISSGLGEAYPTTLPPPCQPVFHSGRSSHTLVEPPRTSDRQSSYIPHSDDESNVPNKYSSESSYPYKRSREETAAVEGLVTAAISQLESIVCRVVIVPGGKTDPTTISVGQGQEDVNDEDGGTMPLSGDSSYLERRLTPNSRNIHQRWMPLGPGLGIAGLAYLEWQKLQREPPLERNDDSIAELHNIETFAGANVVSQESSMIEESTSVEEQLRQAYGSKFCEQLLELVQSAPPVAAICQMPQDKRSHPLVDALLEASLFQSILVTQFHHWQPPDSGCSEPQKGSTSDAGDSGSDDECFDPPWPSEHEAFCAQPTIQDQVVLEIAAGFNSKGCTAHPMEVPKGKMRVVLPGSLRERGEFCLVDVAFMKDPANASTTEASRSNKVPSRSASVAPQAPKSVGDYRWMVRRTRFHCLNDFV